MLKAHGDYILPDNVPANEFLNLEGDKISTSRNWAVWLNEYLQDFPGREDELRYVLCSIAPETKDSEFTWKDFQARVNNELADILGNYIKRVVDLVHRYYNGKVPPSHIESLDIDLQKKNIEISKRIFIAKDKIDELILTDYKFRDALFEVMNIARQGNLYLQETKPWEKIKTDKNKTEKILYISVNICGHLAKLMAPFLPFTSRKILRILNLDESILKSSDFFTMGILQEGHQLNKCDIIFPKITDEEVDVQINKLHDSKMMNEQNQHPATSIQQPITDNPKPEISYDDFSKLDIRIGKILSAEKVEKADKLLKLQIDTGIDKRTVVSGIAMFYKPEEIIGQKVCILLNLAPRKIKGILSQGMILMAENENGELAFVVPSKEFEAGGKIS